jgi:hypothetical protein
LGGKSWRVETKPDGLVVSNGNEALLATNVPCVLRNVVIGSTDFRAQVHAANAGILVWKGKAARLDKGVNVVELSK